MFLLKVAYVKLIFGSFKDKKEEPAGFVRFHTLKTVSTAINTNQILQKHVSKSAWFDESLSIPTCL